LREPPGTWWYELDQEDRVVAVGGEWDPFALQNGAPHAVSARVVGQPLWSFVNGIETMHLLQRLIAGVRASGAPVEVPFRCDAPTIERHMHFHAAPADGGRVRITTRLLSEVPVDSPPAFSSAPPAEGAMVTMCSWCNHVRMADGTWLPLAEAAARLGLFSGARMPAITHGLCHGCMAIMQPLLDDEPLIGDDEWRSGTG
jgi:hypothetical protein